MTDQSTSTPGLITWIAASRPRSGLALLVAGIAVAAIPAVLYSKYGTDLLSIEVLTGLMALVLLVAGIGQRIRPASGGNPVDEARMLVLAIGGLIGLLVAATGVVLAAQWWDFLTRWLRFGEREGAWHVLVALAVLLAGLAIMFISLQAARTEVRHNPGLRRLLFGYNTVLAGVLLFLILAVANVLAYTKLPNLIDSTESGVYKLSDRSIQVLRALDRPTKIYLLMAGGRLPGLDELTTLLSNAQEYAPRLTVETLSTGLNSGRIRELVKEFPQVESEGILIVYGDDKDKLATFIRAEDIMKSDVSPDGQRSMSFEGESRIMTELSFLAENKQKPVVYFTHKNAGEMDFNDAGGGGDRGAQAIGQLQQRLSKRNFDVRALTFDAADPKVPDDATVVVVPGPTRGFTEPVVAALRRYMDDRKGKLVVLTEVPSGRGDTWPATGLEGLLASYKVQLVNERVLTWPTIIGGSIPLRNPDSTLANIADDVVHSKNPIGLAFKDSLFQFLYPRVVRPADAGGAAGNPMVRAEPLLTTLQGLRVWTEGSLTAKATDLLELMSKNPQELRARVSPSPIPLAVMVTESGGPPSMGGAPPKATPRLVVFGNASFVSNQRVSENSPEENFDFFVGTLDWLRERPAGIGIEPRTFKNYMLERSVNPQRLLLLPALLAVVGIFGLGAGVWVVRRR